MSRSGSTAYSVLLDTSFFIRLLKPDDPLAQSACSYYQYFLDHDITMKISTISIAEYCVRGNIKDLPLMHLQVIPFNIVHAQVAGRFASILFEERKKGGLKEGRTLIINDVKLFAQAQVDEDIKYFVTSDHRAVNTIESISKQEPVNFMHMDIRISPEEQFGTLF